MAVLQQASQTSKIGQSNNKYDFPPRWHPPAVLGYPFPEKCRGGRRQRLVVARQGASRPPFGEVQGQGGFCRMAVSALSGTGTGRSAAFRPASVPLDVRRPKVRDRATDMPAERRSASPPTSCRSGRGVRRASMPCCRCSICVGSLRGISRKHWSALLGADAPNLSPGVISRLTGDWQQEYDRWQRRDLSARRYVL